MSRATHYDNPPSPIPKGSIWEFLILNDIRKIDRYPNPVFLEWSGAIVTAPSMSRITNEEVFLKIDILFNHKFKRPE